MAQCDAELYLRLTGERVLLAPGPEGGAPPESRLSTAAHALVAGGAITAGAAQAIVDDYYLALSCRAGGHHLHRRRSQRGQTDFRPALDPAAQVLDIMPTTMTARAVIRVPLDWGEEK